MVIRDTLMTEVKWGTGIRRFGRENYDHGTVSANLQLRISLPRWTTHKYYRGLASRKVKYEHELTKKVDTKEHEALVTEDLIKTPDNKWKRLKNEVLRAGNLLPKAARLRANRKLCEPSMHKRELVIPRESLF